MESTTTATTDDESTAQTERVQSALRRNTEFADELTTEPGRSLQTWGDGGYPIRPRKTFDTVMETVDTAGISDKQYVSIECEGYAATMKFDMYADEYVSGVEIERALAEHVADNPRFDIELEDASKHFRVDVSLKVDDAQDLAVLLEPHMDYLPDIDENDWSDVSNAVQRRARTLAKWPAEAYQYTRYNMKVNVEASKKVLG